MGRVIAAAIPWTQLKGHLRSVPLATLAGIILLGVVILAVLFAPMLAERGPMDLGRLALVPPGGGYLLGTDDLGRDVWSRVLYGGRISLLVGLFSAGIAIVLGLLIGVVAGFSGGLLDELLMRITEAFQILPKLLVAIVAVSMVSGSLANVIIVIGVLSWPPTARLVRAQVMVLRKEEYMSAAILAGSSYARLIYKQILPNVLPILLVSASMQVASAILAEAALSFLGLGDPAFPSWGQMLQQSQGFLRQAWWMSLFPGIALAMTILGINLLADVFADSLSGGAK